MEALARLPEVIDESTSKEESATKLVSLILAGIRNSEAAAFEAQRPHQIVPDLLEVAPRFELWIVLQVLHVLHDARLDPGAFEVIGFLWAGVADPPAPIARPPLDAVVRSVP